ncbi:MAG: hypothetical protein EP305_07480 [Bacteroidetes bacterium]|nr:MAG: hypothetical protein EP305_07480 [Bacteroidota bacterium]
MKPIVFCLLVVLSTSYGTNAQIRKIFHADDSTDLTFTGTKINPYAIEYDTTGSLEITGYIDTYYAWYSDSMGTSDFSLFPTISPRKSQVGLNMIQLSAKYESKNLRGTATLFGGDCPRAAWSGQYNFVQEANVGFRVYKKLWLDAGFFRTHIGLESIQPRENITMSIATTTYFEPYFLSGAKLTWQHSKKLAFQLNAFNSFNQFIENNSNKALGLSMSYSPLENLNISFSTITCDESPDPKVYNQRRLYNNLILLYKNDHWVLGMEGNYGIQKNSVLTDSTKTASIFSTLLAVKYRVSPRWAVYGRFELFSDPNEVLTGPVENGNHELVGIDITGGTVGIEFKPIPNSYFRVEGRTLHAYSNETIFYSDGNFTNNRQEIIVGLGLWF